MTVDLEQLPLRETCSPETQEELAEIVRRCYTDATPLYPLGGGTSLGYGRPVRREGVGLSLDRLDRVVDYPARDMTITVAAGISMQHLAQTLSKEKQRLPVDVPHADRATLGGVIATGSNGPRRYAFGSIRDQVIGIRGVDGHGTCFQGGGRVVKNVAGYDFCKLLTGSMGSLAVITQVTLKLKPIPPQQEWLVCRPNDLAHAERLLSALTTSQTTPSAIELLIGDAWAAEPELGEAVAGVSSHQPLLAVNLEGTAVEVEWMVQQLRREWASQGIEQTWHLRAAEAAAFFARCASFPGDEAPLVLQASVVPSHTTALAAAALQIDPQCAVLAHAGSGIVVLRFNEFPQDGLSRTLISHLQPAAAAGQGNIVILANPSGAEMTLQSVWGHGAACHWLMCRVKDEFDPRHILNPGRFLF